VRVSDRPGALVLAARRLRPADLVAAEARVHALAEDVAALRAALEAEAADLARWERAHAAVAGAALAELGAAERLVRRVARLRAEVERLAEVLRAPPPARTGGRRRAAPADVAGASPRSASAARAAAPPPRPAPDASPGLRAFPAAGADALDLKRLHRKLARLLHPDLAPDDASRARRSVLMATVNDAYARRDRTALELVAERLGAADLDGDPTDLERRAHLAQREAALGASRDALLREAARLRGSSAARTREAAQRRRAAGGDHAALARDEALARAAAARGDALVALDDLAAAARALARLRSAAGAPGSAGARRRRADPLAASPLVRAAATSHDPRRATPAARRLARALAEDAAREVPWVAALTLLAFFAEAASRPPEALATRAAFEERWDALRARWSGSPDLGRALAQLPPHLEVGLRAAPGAIDAGVQLASAELLTGVRLALDDARVREVARAALGVLGPRQRCAACGEEGYAVHLVRTRGLDDIHALACARCGALLRSFWRYGPPEGLEALAPLAVEVGAVAEIRLRLAGAAIAFQLLPGERARFTVGDLERRLRELLLAPHGLAPPAGALAFRAGRARLAPDRPVPAGRALSAGLDAGGPGVASDEAALLAALRASIARRFAR
jgi:hypothetical protein